ncbi:hypothetical protein RLIN73S_02133 [Rhodanobacter lindaniclasticus]
MVTPEFEEGHFTQALGQDLVVEVKPMLWVNVAGLGRKRADGRGGWTGHLRHGNSGSPSEYSCWYS